MTPTEKTFWANQKQKNLLIVGVSPLTGLAVSKWLNQHAVSYSVSDSNLSSDIMGDLKSNQKRSGLPKNIFSGEQTPNQLENITDIILSPGISRDIPLLKIARQKKIPVWCDFDYFYPLYQEKEIIAITGTDGKTTTVNLIYDLLKKNIKIFLCGNVGIPFCNDYPKLIDSEVIVLELSSYMLEDLKQFRASISLITNLSEDHLNRYKSYQEYIETKKNIYQYSTPEDYFLQNVDDEILCSLDTKTAPLSDLKIKTISQDEKRIQKSDYYFRDNYFFIDNEKIKNKALPLVGIHNHYNILFALAVCSILKRKSKLEKSNLNFEDIVKRLHSFSPLPHRLEKITFPAHSSAPFEVYNDSKATTLQAVLFAIDSFPRNIVLLMGGRGKGLDYTAIVDNKKIKKKIKKVFTYGEEGQKIANQLKALEPVYTNDFEKCIERAWQCLSEGDVFLFSSGCMSQDQFENYEQRGDFFKKKVLSLSSTDL